MEYLEKGIVLMTWIIGYISYFMFNCTMCMCIV